MFFIYVPNWNQWTNFSFCWQNGSTCIGFDLICVRTLAHIGMHGEGWFVDKNKQAILLLRYKMNIIMSLWLTAIETWIISIEYELVSHERIYGMHICIILEQTGGSLPDMIVQGSNVILSYRKHIILYPYTDVHTKWHIYLVWHYGILDDNSNLSYPYQNEWLKFLNYVMYATYIADII